MWEVRRKKSKNRKRKKKISTLREFPPFDSNLNPLSFLRSLLHIRSVQLLVFHRERSLDILRFALKERNLSIVERKVKGCKLLEKRSKVQQER